LVWSDGTSFEGDFDKFFDGQVTWLANGDAAGTVLREHPLSGAADRYTQIGVDKRLSGGPR
jgi:hypothetical protein